MDGDDLGRVLVSNTTSTGMNRVYYIYCSKRPVTTMVRWEGRAVVLSSLAWSEVIEMGTAGIGNALGASYSIYTTHLRAQPRFSLRVRRSPCCPFEMWVDRAEKGRIRGSGENRDYKSRSRALFGSYRVKLQLILGTYMISTPHRP